MNGALFWIYVADVLAPALEPGNTVVMDNLAAHRAASVRQAFTASNPTSAGTTSPQQVTTPVTRLERRHF